MKVRVVPIYGYGWSHKESFGDVPLPFELDVRQATHVSNSLTFDLIVGKIRRPHTYEDFWALLYARTTNPEPSYNVLIYADEIKFTGGSRDLPKVEPMATGFAMLDVGRYDAFENSR